MRALFPSLMRLPTVDFPIGKPMTADSAPFTISSAVVMVGVLGSTAAMMRVSEVAAKRTHREGETTVPLLHLPAKARGRAHTALLHRSSTASSQTVAVVSGTRGEEMVHHPHGVPAEIMLPPVCSLGPSSSAAPTNPPQDPLPDQSAVPAARQQHCSRGRTWAGGIGEEEQAATQDSRSRLPAGVVGCTPLCFLAAVPLAAQRPTEVSRNTQDTRRGKRAQGASSSSRQQLQWFNHLKPAMIIHSRLARHLS